MSEKETGVAAFPGFDYIDQHGKKNPEGMTLRQYAAIKLKVPDSGVDWLDEMITQSLRDYFAAKAMQGILSAVTEANSKNITHIAYKMADAMLEDRK